MKAFLSLAPPHFSFSLHFFSLYCGADCRSIIRSLSRLKGLARAVRNTQSYTCSARWVTAAPRPGGKSLWSDARLSYALNLYSDRLQDTKRKEGPWRAQEHSRIPHAVFSRLYPDPVMHGAPASLHHVQSSPHPPPQSFKYSILHPFFPPWLIAKEKNPIPPADLKCQSFAWFKKCYNEEKGI